MDFDLGVDGLADELSAGMARPNLWMTSTAKGYLQRKVMGRDTKTCA
jgi:hypothetical protein